VGRPVIEFYGLLPQFESFAERYNEWGIALVAMAGFTPFPYKVITIASGVTGLNLVSFTLASVVSRGARFFLLAALLWWFGEPIRRFVDRYLPHLTWLFFALLIGGFVAARALL
jgi:membrane protein YqaA with SNARE-associated domain